MSSSFLEAAAARVPTAGRGAGLIDSPTFWAVEAGAPLLRRNAGFLTAEGPPHGWRERLARWPELLSASTPAPAPSAPCDDEAALRIFLRDAERTFQHASHRERMIGALKRLWPEEKDYHQGLGYVCSLLLLFFDEETACAMLLRLARDPAYTPGYWRAAPEPYVRDAMVFARLVERRFPEVAALLQAACVVPEAYASKWYIGLCVHVLPFEALLPFVEGFFRDGYPFLFRFSLALVAAVSPRLLVLKPTDVNLILEIMRLDVCQYPDDYEEGQFFTRLVADAASVDLEQAEIDSLREEEAVKLAEKMRKVKEREAQLAAEASDDEIVFSDEEID